jgi:hypothetical protein
VVFFHPSTYPSAYSAKLPHPVKVSSLYVPLRDMPDKLEEAATPSANGADPVYEPVVKQPTDTVESYELAITLPDENSDHKAFHQAVGCRPSRKAMLTAGFSVVSGWADVVSYKAFGSFAALMTGNTVKMGLSVVDDELNGYYYASILCSYIFGVILFNWCKYINPGGSIYKLTCIPLCSHIQSVDRD